MLHISLLKPVNGLVELCTKRRVVPQLLSIARITTPKSDLGGRLLTWQQSAYAGNGFQVTSPIPEKAGARAETLIAIHQQRYLAALQQEPDYNPIDSGATGFAVVDLYELSEHQARLMLKELRHIVMALDACYVPVGIERYGRTVSDAVPPMAFAEIAGLEAGDYPLAAFKIEGIAADPRAIVELLLKEKLMLDPQE